MNNLLPNVEKDEKAKFSEISIFILFIVCITFIFLKISGIDLINRYQQLPFKNSVDTEGNIIYGEYNRSKYENIINENYSKVVIDNPRVDISKQIDYLLVDYFILREIIADTDEYVFINSHCIDLTNFDTEISYSQLSTNSKDLPEKINYINAAIDDLNDSSEYGVKYRFNLWWYSLGENREEYQYLIDNIHNKTSKLNTDIDNYNKKYNEKISHISILDNLYDKGNEYSESELKEHYDIIIDYYSTWVNKSDIYPQRTRREH